MFRSFHYSCLAISAVSFVQKIGSDGRFEVSLFTVAAQVLIKVGKNSASSLKQVENFYRKQQ